MASSVTVNIQKSTKDRRAGRGEQVTLPTQPRFSNAGKLRIKSKAKRKKETKTKDGLGDFWDNVKHTNIHTIGIPEGEERENRTEKLFEEIIAENFPNPAKDIDIQVQDHRESQTR